MIAESPVRYRFGRSLTSSHRPNVIRHIVTVFDHHIGLLAHSQKETVMSENAPESNETAKPTTTDDDFIEGLVKRVEWLEHELRKVLHLPEDAK